MNEETLLKNKCCKWLKDQKIFFFKLSDKWYSGIPDLLILYKGKVIWVELKTPTGKISMIQGWTITKLHENGFPVHVIRTLEDFKEVMRGLYICKM